MSTATDRFDAPFTAGTEEVADQVRRGMDLIFGFDLEGSEVLEAATQADPACVLGHVLLGVFLHPQGDSSGARRHVRAATAAAPDATDRERSLVELFFGDEPAEGSSQAPSKLEQLEVHLERWPRDFVALFLSARLYPPTHAGRADLYRRNTAAEATMGDDWVYQSHTGMMCQERGDLDRAQQLTERAQKQAPGNVGAAHTMAHLFHERGEITSGLRYLDGWVADHGRPSMVYLTHLGWHAALLAWADDRVDEAVARMQATYEPFGFDRPMRIIDEASFRWRLLLDGVDVPDWSSLDPGGELALADPGFPPRAWSTGLWAAGKGDRDALEVVLAWDGWGDPEGSAPQPATVRAALEGAVAFAAGHHDRCIELIEPVLDDIVFLGGSHAQREVFEDTVIAAAMRADRQDVAVRMLEERLARRRWRRDERLLASARARI